MEIRKSIQNNVETLSIKGKIDALNSQQFENSVFASISSGTSKLIIDLKELEYISSSGLRVFLMVAKKLKTSGKVCLCELQPQVLQIFRISGFDSIFTICNTMEEALKYIA